jgi:hypothetical protein
LPDTLDTAPLGAPVTVQLINYETGACFEGRYETPQRSDQEVFSGKQ